MGWGILAGLGAGALWGLVFVAPRMVTGWSSVDFTAGRFLSYGALSALLLMWPALLGRPLRLPTLAQAKAALLMSVLGFTGYYLLLVFAIRDAGSEVPSLIIGTIPIWMLLLGKPVGLRWATLVPGILLTMAGLALMMQTLHAQAASTATASSGLVLWRGIGFACASMACWTAFGLMNSTWLKKHPEVDATTWANWLGVATGLGALVLWLATGTDIKTLITTANSAQAAMLSIVTGIGSAWLATILWNIASQRLPASLCGQLIVSETIFALLLSFLWDRHWPSGMQITAIILFVAGILASIRAHR